MNVADLVLLGTYNLSATGNAQADVLTANAGADTLSAGSGVATLIGGAGSDTFVVNNASDVVRDSSSTASNTIQSSVSYVLPTDVNTLTLTGTAALEGTGNAGSDVLTANTGADTLNSGAGVDSLVGGTGADVFIINNAADVVSVGATHGVDTIESWHGYTLPVDVADLVLLGTYNLSGTGNAQADVLTANAGADTLTAGGSADTLVSGSGVDSLSGWLGHGCVRDQQHIGRGECSGRGR